jgi:NADH-ubiquinone oxidoreductase chain 5
MVREIAIDRMLVNTILLPLLSSIIGMCFGRFIGAFGIAVLSISNLFISLCITIFYFYTTANVTIYIPLYTWCKLGNFEILFELLFDQVTYIMLLVILTISLIVHIYSTQYLNNDPHLVRFLTWLSLFTFFMLVLVSAENLIQIFIGWEGVGICSYLLINFWHSRIQANKAALKAIFVNKIGDLFLLIAIVFCYFLFGSTSFSIIFSLVPYVADLNINLGFWSINLLNLIGFCFFIGAIGKSAQIGLHIWLPDAMEGPTPVSALLHAATMVTAGVFLIIRLSYFFEYTPLILQGILIIGALTAFFASTIGLLQYDLKRIIAFSTCSQLGYMFVACGLSEYSTALFHLFNHAFFKALLFLSAGNVIHALSDEQDIRKMGGLVCFLPLTFTFFVIASVSLMGFPFLSGFYSKDLIIEYTWLAIFFQDHYIIGSLLLIAACCTAAYSVRLIFFVFLTTPNFDRNKLRLIQEANYITQLPLIFLCLCSIFSGFLFSELFIGVNADFFSSSIFTLNIKTILIEHEFFILLFKQSPLIISGFGVFSLLYGFRYKRLFYYMVKIFSSYFLITFLNQKWFFDKIFNSFMLKALVNFFFSFYIWLDKGFLEFIGPTGISKLLHKCSLILLRLQTGNITTYITYIFIGVIFILILFVFFV